MEPVEQKPTLQDVLFRAKAPESVSADTAVLLEQYKLYVELVDRISERRQHANSFFLSINTGICAFAGYLFSKDSTPELRSLFWCIPLAGILLCYFWYRMVKSYRDLNSAKFLVVHALEERLPVAPYRAEWFLVDEGNDGTKYTPFTHLEIWIPRSFIVMYVAFLLFQLWPKIFPLHTP